MALQQQCGSSSSSAAKSSSSAATSEHDFPFPQATTGVSVRQVGAPPGLSALRANKRDQILAAMEGTSDDAWAIGEVSVKNTFIHVSADVPAKTVQRSKSDSDLSSSSQSASWSSSQQSQQSLSDIFPSRVPHERFELPHERFERTPGASSSAHDETAGRTLGLAWPPLAPPLHAEWAEQDIPAIDADQDQQDQNEPEDWSVGSAQHEEGLCKPCAYWRQKKRCTKGRSCEFCHMFHGRKLRQRPCKAKRNQAKQIAAMLDSEHVLDREQAMDDVRRMCANSGVSDLDKSYLMGVLASKARQQEETYHHPQTSASSAPQSSGQGHGADRKRMSL